MWITESVNAIESYDNNMGKREKPMKVKESNDCDIWDWVSLS